MFLKNKLLAVPVFVTLLFSSVHSIAEDIAVKITGSVYIPPCEINGGQVINVEFNNVEVMDIENARNRREKTVRVVCTYSNGNAYVKFTGSQLGENSNVLATNIRDFGIALYQGSGTSTKLELGEGVNSFGHRITTGLNGNTFTFTAVPFKSGTSDLTVGAFKASANMSISYQ